jgi:hypothetical protein
VVGRITMETKFFELKINFSFYFYWHAMIPNELQYHHYWTIGSSITNIWTNKIKNEGEEKGFRCYNPTNLPFKIKELMIAHIHKQVWKHGKMLVHQLFITWFIYVGENETTLTTLQLLYQLFYFLTFNLYISQTYINLELGCNDYMFSKGYSLPWVFPTPLHTHMDIKTTHKTITYLNMLYSTLKIQLVK